MVLDLSCHIIRQKSITVSSVGPAIKCLINGIFFKVSQALFLEKLQPTGQAKRVPKAQKRVYVLL